MNLSKTIKIIDFYEELENQNIKLSLPFYMISVSYMKINDELINLKNAKNDYEKKSIIESLLENYIRINNKVIRQLFKKNGKEDFGDSFKVYRNKQHKLVITGNGKFRVFKVNNKEEPKVLNCIKKKCVISKLLGEMQYG